MSHECPNVRAGAFECLSNVPGWRQRYSNVSRMPRGQWGALEYHSNVPASGGGTRVSLECPRIAWGAFECHSNIIQISFKYHLNIIQISSKYHSNIIQISFEYPSVWGGGTRVSLECPRVRRGHSSATRISLSQEVKCHSNAPVGMGSPNARRSG